MLSRRRADSVRTNLHSSSSSEASQPVDPGSDQACVWFFATEQNTRGFFDYGRLARCVTFAKTPRELYPCVY